MIEKVVRARIEALAPEFEKIYDEYAKQPNTTPDFKKVTGLLDGEYNEAEKIYIKTVVEKGKEYLRPLKLAFKELKDADPSRAFDLLTGKLVPVLDHTFLRGYSTPFHYVEKDAFEKFVEATMPGGSEAFLNRFGYEFSKPKFLENIIAEINKTADLGLLHQGKDEGSSVRVQFNLENAVFNKLCNHSKLHNVREWLFLNSGTAYGNGDSTKNLTETLDKVNKKIDGLNAQLAKVKEELKTLPPENVQPGQSKGGRGS